MRYILLLLVIGMIGACDSDPRQYVEIETEYGTMKVVLYDETPLHRDNFIKMANEAFYDSLLFHRVIDGFMIQGGDPNSKNATQGQRLGNGGPGYLIDAEIGAPHLYGTLAAARTGGASNPEKKSSGSQFYVVQGRKYSDAELDSFESQKGITYNETQRGIYKEKGGTPMLDMDYTVFGEVVEGFDVIEKIATVQKDRNDRPIEDVIMTIKVVK